MTTKSEIVEWFKEGVKQKTTHMIVACDTFDYTDYPVYVKEGEDVREREKGVKGQSMTSVMEVYNLKQPMEPQIAQNRAFNY